MNGLGTPLASRGRSNKEKALVEFANGVVMNVGDNPFDPANPFTLRP